MGRDCKQEGFRALSKFGGARHSEPQHIRTIATEAGIHFPVFLTRNVFDAYVTVPPNVNPSHRTQISTA